MNESLNILSNNISDEDKSHRVKRIKRNSRSVRLADVLINPSRKTFYNNRTSNLECKVEHNGMVNCSKAIYKDMKIWHASRLSVEDQIRKLKIKLDDLKEIRRHLKETRPDGVIPSENPEESDANTRQTNDNVSENKHKINTNQQSGFSLNTNRVMTHIIETTSESNIQETKHQSTASSINSLKTNNEDDVSESTSSSYPSTPSYTSRHHHSRNNSHHRENTQTQKTTTAFPSSTYNFDTSETMESEYSSINSTDFDFDKYLLQVQNETSMLNESNSDVNVTFASNAVEFTPSFTNNDIKSVSTSATDTPINTPSTSPTPRRFLPQEKYDMNRIIPALGPTRLDINTYGESHGKINNFGALNGTEEERLPPFYIENEDQHMCYCEQDR